MKRVVSVSIGSSKRDHTVEIDLLGERFSISREGFDGDFEAAAERIRELDGVADAIGLGGIDLFLRADGRTYWFRSAKPLAANAKVTPVLDGSGLKGAVEASTIGYLERTLGADFHGKRALVTSGIDRWGLAEGLRGAGAKVVFGDLFFVLGVPKMIHSWNAFRALLVSVAPLAIRMPFKWLYPVGTAQNEEIRSHPLVEKTVASCDIVAGDWQFIRKYLPQDMRGKWIITNTTTAADVELCRERGVELLVTSTPRLEGRSFGTNVIEATMVALDGASGELSPERYIELLQEVGFTPDVRWLQRIADEPE